jgi:RNase P protein component
VGLPEVHCPSSQENALGLQEAHCPSSQENAPALPEVHCPSSQENAHQGRALPADLSTGGGLPEDGVSAGNLPGRILVSVPKRCFKRAVKRNLLKRRIREAYRIQKLPGVDVMFQYNSPELADFAAVRADVTAILSRISSALPEGACPSSQKNAHQGSALPAGDSRTSTGDLSAGGVLPASDTGEGCQQGAAHNTDNDNSAGQ